MSLFSFFFESLTHVSYWRERKENKDQLINLFVFFLILFSLSHYLKKFRRRFPKQLKDQ
jgi:hypothetical protein